MTSRDSAAFPTLSQGSDSPLPNWAAAVSLPEWLTLRAGNRPVIVVAPHGGRRRRGVRRGDSVNDLHTAEIAWELAERLGAHAIINHGLDRNEIDLNRISHLAERAPLVLALLRSAVEQASEQGQAALVLFVHGWNMVLPCCDIGIGLTRREVETHGERQGEGGARTSPLYGRFPTLRQSVYHTTVAAIESSLASRQISAGIGRRYAASGRDNAAQLFSGRHADHGHDDVAHLSRLALAGRADAAQLELGIALRWRGALRDAFLDGMVEALGETSSIVDGEARTSPRDIEPWTLRRDVHSDAEAAPEVAGAGYTLQGVLDPGGDAALFAGVETTGPSSMAGRFCIVLSDGSMMLLVGEGPWKGRAGDYELEGFRWQADPQTGAVDIELAGPMIRYRRHDAYLDLEEGLAGADLVAARIRLRFEPDGDGYGRLRGEIDTDEGRIVVDTTAALDRGGRRGVLPSSMRGRVRVMVAGAGGDMLTLQSDLGEQGWLDVEEGSESAPLGSIRPRPGSEPREGFAMARIKARVPVWRPGPGGVFTRWTFGIALCRFNEKPGVPARETPGLFDLLEVFGNPVSS